ncbi:MAG: STAS domain-containing protein, partial [Leptospira sp.]|nr:STAS domain-containing protein [Leptospira sp.]
DGNELQVKIRKEDLPRELPAHGVILDIIGEVNLYSSRTVKEIINNLIDVGMIRIYVNLEEVVYIDSSGLGTFLNAQSILHKMDGFIKLCSPSKTVAHTLDLTKLRAPLRVHNTLAMAIVSEY